MASEQEGPPPAANPTFAYLDSTFYFDRLITHRPYHASAREITKAWDAGDVEVATSTLTLTEVLYVPLIDADAREKFDRACEPDILDLFRQYSKRRFRLVEVDRTIAEAARELVWSCNTRPKDSIHIASALRIHAPVMFTGDRDLIGLSGKVGGTPTLRIELPSWIVQKYLFPPSA